MRLQKINFKLDKFYVQEHSINFKRDKHCFIGKNGSGKSTLLKAVYKIFRRLPRVYGDYFNIEDSSIEYVIENGDIVYDMLTLEHEGELSVLMHNEMFGYPKFYCPWTIKEYEHLKKLILQENEKCMNVIRDTREKFNIFAQENDIDPNKFYVVYEHLANNGRSYSVTSKLEENEFDGWISGRGSRLELYRLREPEYLIAIDCGNIPDHVSFGEKLFKQFRIDGTSVYKDYLDEFDKLYPGLYDELMNHMKEMNDLIDTYNVLFADYSDLYEYLVRNTIQNVEFIDHNINYNLDSEIITTALKVIKPKLYELIGDDFLSDVEDKIKTFEYYSIMKDFKVLHGSIGSYDDENSFKKAFVDSDDAMKVFIDDLPDFEKRVRRFLANRDIIKDYESGFEEIYFDMNYEYIHDWLSKVFVDVVSEYDSRIDTINIVPSDEKPYSIHNTKVFYSEADVEIGNMSSGTIWGLRFGLIKQLLSYSDLLLIDEPALFLHQSKQLKVIQTIVDMDCKVMYTTHTAALIPLNINEVSMSEVVKTDDEIICREIDNNIEEVIVEALELEYLQGMFVDYRKKVVFVHPDSKHFLKTIIQLGIDKDLQVIPGIVRSKPYKLLIDLLRVKGIEIVCVIQNRGRYESLIEIVGSKNIYLLEDFVAIAKKNNYKKLSDFF